MGLFAAQRARLNLSQGNITAAGQWADSITLTPERLAAHSLDSELSTLARVRIAQGQSKTALDMLTKLKENGRG